MIIEIPGREQIEIKHVIFDYNGTIAIDGKLIKDVKAKINQFAETIHFHVITADTYGTVAAELEGVNCTLVNLSSSAQFKRKTDYLNHLGANHTLSVGNGYNDKALLKQSRLGIALIQAEGVCTETLLSSDIVCLSIMDVFAYLETPNRLKATLRS